MATDRLFVLLLVILLPLTGCLDTADTAEAQDSEEETTIVNNYYNTTTIQTVEPQMVHFYAYLEDHYYYDNVTNITINENQTIEWLDSQVIQNDVITSYAYVSNISCIDSDADDLGSTSQGFAIKGEGECIYTLQLSEAAYTSHVSIIYLIHEL